MPCYTITYRTEVDLSIDVEAADWDHRGGDRRRTGPHRTVPGLLERA